MFTCHLLCFCALVQLPMAKAQKMQNLLSPLKVITGKHALKKKEKNQHLISSIYPVLILHVHSFWFLIFS